MDSQQQKEDDAGESFHTGLLLVVVRVTQMHLNLSKDITPTTLRLQAQLCSALRGSAPAHERLHEQIRSSFSTQASGCCGKAAKTESYSALQNLAETLQFPVKSRVSVCPTHQEHEISKACRVFWAVFWWWVLGSLTPLALQHSLSLHNVSLRSVSVRFTSFSLHTCQHPCRLTFVRMHLT